SETLISRLSGLPIVIFGDLMLDEFIFGRVNRISPEAPVPVLEFDHNEVRVGGAGNVAHNARRLGGAVELVGVIGRDDYGRRVKEELLNAGVGTAGIVMEDGRQTTRKVRIVTNRN